MKLAAFLLLLFACEGRSDLEVGAVNTTVTHMKIGLHKAAPPEPREDYHYFSDPGQDDVIKGIKVHSLDKNEMKEVTITEGGVGHYFVNVSVKGQPGEGLNYQMNVYS